MADDRQREFAHRALDLVMDEREHLADRAIIDALLMVIAMMASRFTDFEPEVVLSDHACPYCGQRFRTRRGVDVHVGTNHREERDRDRAKIEGLR
jgi:uncharacterized C2H2 Zn-finger protein